MFLVSKVAFPFRLAQSIDQVNRALDENMRQLLLINARLERLQYGPSGPGSSGYASSLNSSGIALALDATQHITFHRIVLYVLAGLFISYILRWLLY